MGLRKHYYKEWSGGDEIPAELFQFLKDDAVKVMHSLHQQIWKKSVASDWKRSVFIPIIKKANAKECSKWVSVTQSCPTLCDPMDCSPPGTSVHEIFQARILEWVAISFSKPSSQDSRQLCSFHMLARLCSKSFNLGFSSTWTENFQVYKLGSKRQRN